MEALDHLTHPHSPSSPRDKAKAIKELGTAVHSSGGVQELTSHPYETLDGIVEVLNQDDAHTRPEEKTAALEALETLCSSSKAFASEAAKDSNLIPQLTKLSDRHHVSGNERTMANRILKLLGDVKEDKGVAYPTPVAGSGIIEGR